MGAVDLGSAGVVCERCTVRGRTVLGLVSSKRLDMHLENNLRNSLPCGCQPLLDPEFDCPHFYYVLFIQSKIRVGCNVKVRILDCQTPL